MCSWRYLTSVSSAWKSMERSATMLFTNSMRDSTWQEVQER